MAYATGYSLIPKKFYKFNINALWVFLNCNAILGITIFCEGCGLTLSHHPNCVCYFLCMRNGTYIFFKVKKVVKNQKIFIVWNASIIDIEEKKKKYYITMGAKLFCTSTFIIMITVIYSVEFEIHATFAEITFKTIKNGISIMA